MQLRHGPLLLARLPGLGLQPASPLLSKGVNLAVPFRRRELRFNRPSLQMLLDASAIGLEPMASNGFDA